MDISIHALLAESDYDNGNPVAVSDLFLSTLSLRRATRETVPRGGHIIFLSTLSLRRATPRGPSSNTTILYFYPRSPCGERRRRPSSPLHHPYFYPRSPCGERLQVVNVEQDTIDISIHALLAESDCVKRFQAADISYFYPRSPCGERQSTSL